MMCNYQDAVNEDHSQNDSLLLGLVNAVFKMDELPKYFLSISWLLMGGGGGQMAGSSDLARQWF